MPEFEISIYNMEVVEALESGKRHKDLDDQWAETHVIEFNAKDEAGARRKAESRYPPARGYIITDVSEI